MRKIDLTSFNVATSETARNINRRIVLDLIRTRQPVSRADLARLSGLQRSTISVITDQLVKEQWIAEGAFGHLPRGRKPRFLHLNVERTGIIGINVRPSETNVALADLNARFIFQESFPTAANSNDFIEDLIEHISALIKSHPQVFFEGIGVSVPGRVDLKSKTPPTPVLWRKFGSSGAAKASATLSPSQFPKASERALSPTGNCCAGQTALPVNSVTFQLSKMANYASAVIAAVGKSMLPIRRR